MGTPNTNRAHLVAELTQILSKPIYSQLLAREIVNNSYRAKYAASRQALSKLPGTRKPNPPSPDPSTPAAFAEKAIRDAFGKTTAPKLLEPIKALEIGSMDNNVSAYRAYDGISHKTALTLGRWWCDKELLQQIVTTVRDLNGTDGHQKVLDFMKSSMFIHPTWNLSTDVAKLTIPAGATLPVIVGLGDWRALKDVKADPATIAKYPPIKTKADLIDKYKLMPIPGPQQTFIPFIPDMWVVKIPHLSPDWPFA